MTLLALKLRPGQSIFDQLVSAAQKAILTSEFSSGQPFPSVRTLASELKIHPNTAHKAIQYLIQERWLEMMPGIGTVVATPPSSRKKTRSHVIEQEIASLIAEAQKIGMSFEELTQTIAKGWKKAESAREASWR